MSKPTDQYVTITYRRIKATPEEQRRLLKLLRGNPVYEEYNDEEQETDDNHPQSNSGKLAGDAPASHLRRVR